MDKNIADILKIVEGKIEDRDKIALREIDTIVNAANPTLMGSDQGVDGSIHAAVNGLSQEGELFAERIRKELEDHPEKKAGRGNMILCSRGRAVKTSGYKLCKNIIHVVGSQYDGKSESGIDCSSSRIDILESCYYEIVKIIRENADIKNIAIPVIGAGDYGFPFRLAVEIALAGVGNALVDWKNEDEELFEMRELNNIYYYIYEKDPKECRKYKKIADEVLHKYKPLFRNGKKVVFQNSFIAHVRYMNEVIRYDRKRGYFAAARDIRVLLMALRFVFMPYMLVKDIVGKIDWEKRRNAVERFALAKALCPIAF